jgi:hypothetical protein
VPTKSGLFKLVAIETFWTWVLSVESSGRVATACPTEVNLGTTVVAPATAPAGQQPQVLFRWSHTQTDNHSIVFAAAAEFSCCQLPAVVLVLGSSIACKASRDCSEHGYTYL